MLTERGTGDCTADSFSVFLFPFNGGGGWKTREVIFSSCGGSIHVFSSNLTRGRGREDEERGVRKRRRGGGEREGRIKARPQGLMHVYGLTLVLKIQTARI